MKTVAPPLITLRPTQVSDLPLLFEFQKDAEARWMAAFTSAETADKEAYLAKWTRLLADPTIVSRTIVMDNDTIVGSVGAYLMHGERQVTYGIDRTQWGKGLATAALQLFLQEVDERPLFARTAFDNHASQRVVEKCGFVRHGTERGFAHARGAEIEEAVYRLAE